MQNRKAGVQLNDFWPLAASQAMSRLSPVCHEAGRGCCDHLWANRGCRRFCI